MPTHQMILGLTLSPPIGDAAAMPRVAASLPSVARAGYFVVEADIPAWQNEMLLEACRRHAIRPVVRGIISSLEDVKDLLDVAAQIRALCATVRVQANDAAGAWIPAFLDEMLQEAEQRQVPLLLQCLGESPAEETVRIAQWCELLPQLRLALDPSCCVNHPSGEILLERAELIYGELSSHGAASQAQTVIDLWGEAMTRWASRARPGTALVFIPMQSCPVSSMEELLSCNAQTVTTAKQIWEKSTRPTTRPSQVKPDPRRR